MINQKKINKEFTIKYQKFCNNNYCHQKFIKFNKNIKQEKNN